MSRELDVVTLTGAEYDELMDAKEKLQIAKSAIKMIANPDNWEADENRWAFTEASQTLKEIE